MRRRAISPRGSTRVSCVGSCLRGALLHWVCGSDGMLIVILTPQTICEKDAPRELPPRPPFFLSLQTDQLRIVFSALTLEGDALHLPGTNMQSALRRPKVRSLPRPFPHPHRQLTTFPLPLTATCADTARFGTTVGQRTTPSLSRASRLRRRLWGAARRRRRRSRERRVEWRVLLRVVRHRDWVFLLIGDIYIGPFY